MMVTKLGTRKTGEEHNPTKESLQFILRSTAEFIDRDLCACSAAGNFLAAHHRHSDSDKFSVHGHGQFAPKIMHRCCGPAGKLS